MSSVLELHHKAMEWAEEGQFQLDRGDQSGALASFRKAMELERAAAYATHQDAEPDRSVLFRSAGSLALDCKELRVAEQLLAMGLAGYPPEEIAEEIRDLLEQVHFRRHLEVRGLTLDATEMQMSIAGDAVGFGVASSDEFVSRVRAAETLVLRTVERRLQYPYREGGSPKHRLRDRFGVFLSEPRAASFAFTLKLGRPTKQMDLFSDDEASAVIDEVLDLLEVVQARDRDELAHRIPEQPYRVNFNALAKKIAPDGERVSMVGLTAHHPGRIRRVAFTRIRKELADFVLPDSPKESTIDASDRRVTVRGVLHYANVIGREDTIKLEDQNGSVYEILVPEGMMTDIVRPLWDDEVIVTGTRRRKRIELEDIVPVGEADNEFEEND